MLEIIVKKLVWDTYNIEHISKHSVTVKEVDKALRDKHKKFLQGHSGRAVVLGRSEKRLLAVVLNPNEKLRHYVVTVRDMDKKERKIYREEANL